MKRILIADDVAIFRNEFRLPLEAVGFEVETAKSGRDAIVQLQRQTFDGILFDTTLPDCTLATFTRVISSLDVWIPTVMPMLPSYERIAYGRLRFAGFHPIIVKSMFRPHRFAQLVDRALDPNRATDDLEEIGGLVERFLERHGELRPMPGRAESVEASRDPAAFAAQKATLDRMTQDKVGFAGLA